VSKFSSHQTTKAWFEDSDRDSEMLSRYRSGSAYLYALWHGMEEHKWLTEPAPAAFSLSIDGQRVSGHKPSSAFFTDLQTCAMSQCGVRGLDEAITKVRQKLSEQSTA
jgi:hypothetical protein